MTGKTGWLKGWKCPECGQAESFDIRMICEVRVTPNGGTLLQGDPSHENVSCVGCRHGGVADDFCPGGADYFDEVAG